MYRLDGPDGHNRFPARFDKRDVEQLNTLRLFAGEELLPD